MTEKHKKWFKILAAVALAMLVLWAMDSKKQASDSLGVDGLGPEKAELSLPTQRAGKAPMVDDYSGNSASAPEMAESSKEAGLAQMDSGTDLPAERKIVKNGSLSMQVSRLEESVDKISEITKAQGGVVHSSNIYSNGGEPVRPYYTDKNTYPMAAETGGSNLSRSGLVTVKVPADKFEDTMKKLKEIASQVLSESTNTDDITETYIDLEVQLKNKRAEEEAFVRILDQSGKIDDVLAVTRQIARVRGEIERLEASKRFYDSQTAMSQITISLSEDSKVGPISQDWRPWQTVKDSAKALIKNFQNTVDDLIYFIIAKLPGLLLTLLVIYIIWKIGKKVYLKIKGGQNN